MDLKIRQLSSGMHSVYAECSVVRMCNIDCRAKGERDRIDRVSNVEVLNRIKESRPVHF